MADFYKDPLFAVVLQLLELFRKQRKICLDARRIFYIMHEIDSRIKLHNVNFAVDHLQRTGNTNDDFNMFLYMLAVVSTSGTRWIACINTQ